LLSEGRYRSPRNLGAAIDVSGLLRELADGGLAVLLVVHDLALAAAIADRVVVVHDGRTEAAGGPAEVLAPERLGRIWGADARLTAEGGRTGFARGLDRFQIRLDPPAG
jgi:ABC-type hemin transport system ATPase subunit